MLGLVSCEYDYIVEDIVPPPTPNPDNPTLFSTQVEPIFQDRCIACHDTRKPVLTTGSAFASLTNGGYINTDNPQESKVYQRATDGHGNNMSSAERTLLLQWITEGAKNN